MAALKQKKQSAELVTQMEAAKMLGVPPKIVRRLVERGILEPVKKKGAKKWFDLQDISEASDALDQKLSFPGILEASVRAHTAAVRVERKLTALLEFFGVEPLQAQPTKDQVEATHLKGHQLATTDLALSAPDIMSWAKCMLRVDAAYLQLAGHYLRRSDPWLFLLAGTDCLMRRTPVEQIQEDPDMAMALSMLSYARKYLVAEAYSYCRFTLGKKVAEISFPDTMRGEVNEIIGVLLRS